MTFEEWKEKHSDLIENVAITFFNYERGVDTKTCYDELEYLLQRAFKAGKPKWHDLRKDQNDLPQMIKDERHISKRVWVDIRNWGTEYGHYDYNKNCWIVRCRIVNLPILGWIEIPEFEEE